MDVIKLVLLYFAAVNLIGFFAFFVDKRRSIRSKWRIPETTLLTIALLGGSIGSLIGMKYFRHKTQKPLFYIGIPAILIFETLFIIIIVFFSRMSFMVQ